MRFSAAHPAPLNAYAHTCTDIQRQSERARARERERERENIITHYDREASGYDIFKVLLETRCINANRSCTAEHVCLV